MNENNEGCLKSLWRTINSVLQKQLRAFWKNIGGWGCFPKTFSVLRKGILPLLILIAAGVELAARIMIQLLQFQKIPMPTLFVGGLVGGIVGLSIFVYYYKISEKDVVEPIFGDEMTTQFRGIIYLGLPILGWFIIPDGEVSEKIWLVVLGLYFADLIAQYFLGPVILLFYLSIFSLFTWAFISDFHANIIQEFQTSDKISVITSLLVISLFSYPVLRYFEVKSKLNEKKS